MVSIPLPDTLGTPATTWMITVIYCISLALHTSATSLLIGIPLVTLAHRIVGYKNPLFAVLNQRMMGYLTAIVALAIATAILPLLMTQVLAGNFYYTSTILIGCYMLLIPLAVALLFIPISKLSRNGDDPVHRLRKILYSVILVLIVLFIASILTNNSVLLNRPDLWGEFLRQYRIFPVVRDPTFAPRFAILLSGSVTAVGLLIAGLGNLGKVGEGMSKYGYRLSIAFAIVGICSVLWYYISLPRLVRVELAANPTALSIALGSAMLLIGSAILGLTRPRNPVWALTGIAFFILSQLGSSCTYSMTRLAWLSEYFRPQDLPLRTQIVPEIIFFVFLATALAVMGWMVYWIIKSYRIELEN